MDYIRLQIVFIWHGIDYFWLQECPVGCFGILSVVEKKDLGLDIKCLINDTCQMTLPLILPIGGWKL